MSRRYRNHFIFRAYVSFVRAYGRLKKFKIKTLNLHKLSKSFGLDEAAAKET